MSWEFGHPIPQLWSHEDERDEEDTHHNKETTNVFHLATNDNTPLGIDGMVHERPEKPAHADGEEKREGKEVGECELLRIREGTEGHCGKGDKGKGDETEKATADMLVVESVVTGLWWFVSAHLVCASNFARSVGGTSLIVAPPWDFWSARM